MKIKTLMAVLIGLVCCMSSVNALSNTKTLDNFNELLQALDSGNQVRAVIHFDKCKLETGTEIVSEISFGFNYDWYNHYYLPINAQNTKEVIATSKNIFSVATLNNLGSINNYLRLHVFKDNTARVFGAVIDPKTYEQKITASFLCSVSNNQDQAGVMLYTSESL